MTINEESPKKAAKKPQSNSAQKQAAKKPAQIINQKESEPKSLENSQREISNTQITVAKIGAVGLIIAAIIGIFQIDLKPNNIPNLSINAYTSTSTPTLSVAEQILILGATATKSVELTSTQFALEVIQTTEAEMAAQKIRDDRAATGTQKALSPTQTAEQIQFITSTAIANITATAQVTEMWQKEHNFLDEFTDDVNGWSGNDKSATVNLDPSNGILNFETNKNNSISFWKCDECFLPTDHNNYSFEVKYFAPKANTDFNFGLLFGCNQFDEELVSCQAIQLVNQNYIRVVKSGTSIEYQVSDYFIEPNEKGLVSVRWEVSEQELKLWINNQVVMNNLSLDGGAGGFFGFYCDPPGSKVEIERIEILPLP